MCVQIKKSIPTTMASYVRNIYGKHVVTDEPVDYVQQSVRLTISLCVSVLFPSVCMFGCLSQPCEQHVAFTSTLLAANPTHNDYSVQMYT